MTESADIPAGTIEVELTIPQWTYLLQGSRMQSWPKAIGQMQFNDGLRAEIIEDLGTLKRHLVRLSPMAQSRTEKKWIFGKEENWKRDGQGTLVDLVEPDAKHKYHLDQSMQNAVYWLTLYAYHPSSPISNPEKPGGPVGQLPSFDEIILPIADALSFRKQLRKDIGLTPDRKKTQILKDGDSAWDAEKPSDKPAKKEKPPGVERAVPVEPVAAGATA